MVKAQILLLLECFPVPMVWVFFHCLIFSFSANKFRMPNVKKETGDFRFLHALVFPSVCQYFSGFHHVYCYQKSSHNHPGDRFSHTDPDKPE